MDPICDLNDTNDIAARLDDLESRLAGLWLVLILTDAAIIVNVAGPWLELVWRQINK